MTSHYQHCQGYSTIASFQPSSAVDSYKCLMFSVGRTFIIICKGKGHDVEALVVLSMSKMLVGNFFFLFPPFQSSLYGSKSQGDLI